MDFYLKINTDNAAFEGNPEAEVGRILDKICDKLLSGSELPENTSIRDINGNTVGEYGTQAAFAARVVDMADTIRYAISKHGVDRKAIQRALETIKEEIDL